MTSAHRGGVAALVGIGFGKYSTTKSETNATARIRRPRKRTARLAEVMIAAQSCVTTIMRTGTPPSRSGGNRSASQA